MGKCAWIKRISLVLVLSLLGFQLVSLFGAFSPAYAQGLFIRTSGTQILDGKGNPIILRGLNYYGYDCANMRNEMHVEADYARFASLGFNVVRLPVGWMWFEPRPGVFDTSYLNIINKDIQWAKKYGLYVILDMHQDWWSPRFYKSDGTRGCGAPVWTVAQYPATKLGRFEATENFWINDTLQLHYVAVWEMLAQRYANESTVAGYDIMNEPPDPAAYNWVTPSLTLNSNQVGLFYLKVITSIRSVDPNHVIFLEPTSEDTVPANFTFKDNIVWSPHFYPLAFESHFSDSNMTVLDAYLQALYEHYVMTMGVPMWIGEFGAFMTDQTYLNWLSGAIGIFNQYRVGYAWWPYQGGPIQSIPAPVTATA